jgi:hypothetical protein
VTGETGELLRDWNSAAVSGAFFQCSPTSQSVVPGRKKPRTRRGKSTISYSPSIYLAGGSWLWVDAGALSGFPPGI